MPHVWLELPQAAVGLAETVQDEHHAGMVDPLAVFDAALRRVLDSWGLPIDDERIGRLRAHFEAVVTTNRTMNLTRITDPVEAAVRHYADSLALLLCLRDRDMNVRTVLDIGTGAGFPAVPLAVMRPDWSVTALDARRKKIEFLQRTAATIGLSNLHAVHAHTRHWQPGARFPLVVFRALAVLPDALVQAARHVDASGWVVAYQAAEKGHDQRERSGHILAQIGMKPDEPYPYRLRTSDRALQRFLHVYHPAAPG